MHPPEYLILQTGGRLIRALFLYSLFACHAKTAKRSLHAKEKPARNDVWGGGRVLGWMMDHFPARTGSSRITSPQKIMTSNPFCILAAGFHASIHHKPLYPLPPWATTDNSFKSQNLKKKREIRAYPYYNNHNHNHWSFHFILVMQDRAIWKWMF